MNEVYHRSSALILAHMRSVYILQSAALNPPEFVDGWCCEFNFHYSQLYFLLKLFKTFDVNSVQKYQKCQICVENENLD